MPLIVVAAALIAPDGTILTQLRPPHGAHPGLWEFPGGKREAGEGDREALARELAEELGITVDLADLAPCTFSVERRSDKELILLLFLCRSWTGTIAALHASDLRWVVPEDLPMLAMPPADLPLALALADLFAD